VRSGAPPMVFTISLGRTDGKNDCNTNLSGGAMMLLLNFLE
jgi:hypothetical protein